MIWPQDSCGPTLYFKYNLILVTYTNIPSLFTEKNLSNDRGSYILRFMTWRYTQHSRLKIGNFSKNVNFRIPKITLF